ncbi:MAG: hypothetical protein LBL33_02480 [Tannerella sp.]|nr:hypothetical protein [Tannerella sp.]
MKGTETGEKTKEESAAAGKEGIENPGSMNDMTKDEVLALAERVGRDQKSGNLLTTETPSGPVEMEVKVFDKPESSNYKYYFETGLVFPATLETIGSKTDKFAFSPQKMFDSDPLTCMAVTQDYLKSNKQRFLSLYTNYWLCLNRSYVTPKITGFVIEGGYFDEAYYRKNARVKKIRMVIESDEGNNSEKTIINETFVLKDTMEPQVFIFKNPPKWRIGDMNIYVTDTYPGEEWQDVCVSGFWFLSNNYLVPVKLNPECNTYIDWYCDNKLPVTGRWWVEISADIHNGIINITYDGEGRITRLKMYDAYGEYVERPVELTCSYIYSKDKIIVYDETNNRRICEYGFQDGKLVYERRNKFNLFDFSTDGYDDSIEKKYIYTNGKDSSDNVREFVVRDDQYGHEILRIKYNQKMRYNLSDSEHDVYDTNGVIVRSRREDEWILPPVQFLKLGGE